MANGTALVAWLSTHESIGERTPRNLPLSNRGTNRAKEELTDAAACSIDMFFRWRGNQIKRRQG